MVKRLNLKKRRRRYRFLKLRVIVYVVIIYVSFSYTFYYSFNTKKMVSNEEFINLLMSSGNANILKEYKVTNVVNSTMKFIFNIDFTNPNSFFNSSILKFGEVSDDTKVIALEYNDDYSNMEELEIISSYIKDPNPVDVDSPVIYLYNSHQLENYSSDNLDVYGITPNVLMASYILRENLNRLGVSTIVEDGNMSEILSSNGWNYSYSYKASRSLMEEKSVKYSSLKYFIDIHRDSISHEYSTVSIENKDYAKVMFVIGLDHDNWEDNYSFAEDINNLIGKYYPGLSRGILKKEGKNVNGIYNQDFSGNCLLIEVGGVENTIEEVYNTMEALSIIFNKYISGEE